MKKLLSLSLMLSLGLATVTPALNAAQSQTVAESQANPADASGWQAAKKWWRSGRNIKALNRQEKKAFESLMKKFTIRVIIAAIIAMIGGITYKKYRSEQERKYQEDWWSPSLLAAAATRDFEGVTNALKRGANVNAIASGGHTALTWAVEDDRPDTVNFLIKSGADVNAKDKNGDTPLIWAVATNNLPIASFLIEKGAKVDTKGNHGDTALMIAISADPAEYNEDIVKLLIAKSRNLKIKNNDGETALTLTKGRNISPEIIAALKK